MKFCFAICDDNKEQSAILNHFIKDIFRRKSIEIVVDEFESGLDLIECVKNSYEKYSIFFLDMQMPIINGIEVGKQIREINKKVIIIYVTGFIDYAFNAFEIRAFGYILKPINSTKLEKVIEEAIATNGFDVDHDDKNTKCLTVNYNKKIQNINIEDIIFVEKIKNKVQIVCINGRYEGYDSLTNLRKYLNDENFLQTHQGYIINKKTMSRYENQTIILTQEYVIPVSKKNIKNVKKAFYESLR